MNKITINPEKKLAPLGDLYGIFFEDLNHAADGGLYAEMVRNRAFEFSQIDNPKYRALTAWTKIERDGAKLSLAAENKSPLSVKNPHYLMMDVYKTGGGAGISNEGYNGGMVFEAGESYVFSCFAKSAGVTLRAALEDVDGNEYAAEEFTAASDEWTRYSFELTPSKTDYRGRLAITAKNTGKVYLDMVSLFPKKTFRGHGLRADLGELLAELKPKFMRFPGGCLIHDGSLNSDDRNSTYRWKNTIGSLEDRPSRRNNWGYNQSLGLGYYEYFVLCEDLGAKPIPVLPAGYNPHSGEGAAIDDLGEWIDDALDLIEFANGGDGTKWGKIRAKLGHPEPFGLEYIGIGNEEVGQEFFDRYTYFHRAIRAKYPDIKIINSSGPFAAGTEFERGWKSARENGSDLVDEHYYMSPEWFIANMRRYDGYSSNGPKVFLGEYASWGNTYYNALTEAAYMTRLEENADVVSLACYAPLFANTDYVDWEPDMIWFDNHRSYGSANYYVQKLFMNNQGTDLLEVKTEGFEKTTVLGANKISGDIIIETEEETTVEFSDISLSAGGETKTHGDFTGYSKERVNLGDVSADDYTLRFKAKRVSGPRGLRVKFGYTDDENYIGWILGGWANGDCCVETRVNDRTSAIKQKVFSLASGVTYEFKLEVSGRSVTVYINGEKQFEITDKQPVMEELYLTASLDAETGEVIIKAVNLRDESASAEVRIMGKESVSGTVYELSGCELSDMNSFEEPRKVCPTEREFSDKGEFRYEFPKRSVTVMRLK